MPKIDKDFVISLHSFKENSGECEISLFVCAGMCKSKTLDIWSEKTEERPKLH